MILTKAVLLLGWCCAVVTPSTPRLHERVEWVQVAPGEHLRIVSRTFDETLPVLVYQPFAVAWPQLYAGDKVFAPLADSFTLVTYDPRGIGGSRGGALDNDALYEDLIAVLEYAARRSASQRCFVVSISSSAAATVVAAHRRSDLIEGVLFAAPVLQPFHLIMPYYEAAVADVWGVPPAVFRRLPSLAQVTLTLLRVPYHACHRRWLCSGEFYNPWTFAGSPLYPMPFLTYTQAGLAMMRIITANSRNASAGPATPSDMHMQLTDIDVPVRFLAGETDFTFTPETHAYADALGAPVQRVPNASHAVHLENPVAFRDAVRALLPAGNARGAMRDAWDAHAAAPPSRAHQRYVPRTLGFGTQFALGILVLVTALCATRLAPWVARKLVHVCIGVLLVHAELEDWRVRASVYVVTALTLALTAAGLLGSAAPTHWMRFLHTGVSIDPGVVFYVCICSFACAVRLPFVTLLPLFTADPAGAIVGRSISTPKLYGSKSVGGTAAVFVTAFLTLNEADALNRLVGALVIAVLELYSGDYDNPAIGGFLLARAIGNGCSGEGKFW